MKTRLVLAVAGMFWLCTNMAAALEGPPEPVRVEVVVKSQLPADPEARQALLRDHLCSLQYMGTSTVVVGMDLVIAARFKNESTILSHTFRTTAVVTPAGGDWFSREDGPTFTLGPSQEVNHEFFYGTVSSVPPVNLGGEGSSPFFAKVGADAWFVGSGISSPGVPLYILSSCQ